MTTTAAPARVFGSGIRRREDPRLLTGTAKYTADITLPGMVHAAVLRSPHGHARITALDAGRLAPAERGAEDVAVSGAGEGRRSLRRRRRGRRGGGVGVPGVRRAGPD